MYRNPISVPSSVMLRYNMTHAFNCHDNGFARLTDANVWDKAGKCQITRNGHYNPVLDFLYANVEEMRAEHPYFLASKWDPRTDVSDQHMVVGSVEKYSTRKLYCKAIAGRSKNWIPFMVGSRLCALIFGPRHSVLVVEINPEAGACSLLARTWYSGTPLLGSTNLRMYNATHLLGVGHHRKYTLHAYLLDLRTYEVVVLGEVLLPISMGLPYTTEMELVDQKAMLLTLTVNDNGCQKIRCALNI